MTSLKTPSVKKRFSEMPMKYKISIEIYADFSVSKNLFGDVEDAVPYKYINEE